MRDIVCGLIAIATIAGIIYLTNLPKPNTDVAVGIGLVGVLSIGIIKQ